MDSKQKTVVGVLSLLVVVFAAGTVYFYNQYAAIKKNPQKVAQETVNSLVAQVSKLIILPNETPTVATVVDAAKLKDQPFFANAKAGDKVLIYTNAKKAILYSVSEDKILEVAPLTIGNNQGAPAPAAPAKTESATSTQ